MELYLQPTDWSCLPTSFGILLDLTPKEMFEAIGHDGSEIIWPELPDPHCRKSFHPQECIDVCIKQLIYPIEIQRECWIQPYDYEVAPFNIYSKNVSESRFFERLKLNNGVLIGKDKRQKSHAVAWNLSEQMIYDPIGSRYGLDDFNPYLFYAFY